MPKASVSVWLLTIFLMLPRAAISVRHCPFQKLINILHRRIEPGMKQPERVRRVGDDHDLRDDTQGIELVTHFFALLKGTIGTAIDKEHGRAAAVNVGDRRCVSPDVRPFLERPSDESRVGIQRSFKLLFDVPRIHECYWTVNVDYRLHRARETGVVAPAFEIS